jgi:cysteamine dioxygenase
MPLHDHPNMTGLLKVVSGKVKSQSYTRINADEKEIIVKAEEPKMLDEKSGSVLLRPDFCNYHELTAVDGPAAFFDILSPPYSDIDDTSEDSRHCSFYKKIVVENSNRNAILRLIKIPCPNNYFCDTVYYEQPDFLR